MNTEMILYLVLAGWAVLALIGLAIVGGVRERKREGEDGASFPSGAEGVERWTGKLKVFSTLPAPGQESPYYRAWISGNVETVAPWAVLEYLRAKEWSMGNGQCPECDGCPEDWYGHPCYTTPDTIGHKRDCKLAAAIASLGGDVLFVGDFQPC